jgi:pilus assembly protein Flp/PilA
MRKLNDKLLKLYIALRYRERGATAVEYGLIVALIAAVIVTVVALLGGKIRDAFQTVVDALTPAP